MNQEPQIQFLHSLNKVWKFLNEICIVLGVGDENYRTGLSCLCPPAPQQPYQKLTFTFDHVFTPESTQESVFEEISQLVQSALDGYKVHPPPHSILYNSLLMLGLYFCLWSNWQWKDIHNVG